jgi:phenylalanyl-tRNA synthetase beta chain
LKFSYQWLSELVEDLSIDAKEVSRLITLHTAESEGVETHGALLAGACPATVLRVEAIPNSHNVKAEVMTDKYGAKTLACGAPNCKEGLRTMYVPLGVKRVSGVDSDGMLASPAELGINKDHDGIIALEGDLDLAPDSVIEIDNKSLTHRPDLWGHYGMARELAAITKLPLVDPVSMELLPAGEPAIEVVVEEPELCPRYSAQVFEGIVVGEAPWWLQYRLETIGLNSINNIVDVTNWVLAELPQPTHAFDADKLQGKIIVRKARAGERLRALNDIEYELTPDDLVIADEAGPVAIAGIIGGKDSAIGDATTRIVFESANFNASAIRKSSSRLKLRTDASMRFEKAQDPENTLRAIARAAELLELVCPGVKAVGGVRDVRVAAKAATVIEVEMSWLRRKLGRAIGQNEVVGILERLCFQVQVISERLRVTVPTWRATKDVSIPDDLVEEVGRSVGYATIDPQAPLMAVVPPPAVNPSRTYWNGLRRIATQQGYTEVYNYSFISEEQAKKLGIALEAHVRVLNPIASDQSLMRTTLLHGVLKNFEDNRRHFGSFRFFEIGKEIHKQPAGLPEEAPHLVAGFYEGSGDGSAGLAELRRLAECLAGVCEVRPVTEVRSFEHPKRAAEIWAAGVLVGRLFEFHPSVVEGRAAVLDLDLRVLEGLVSAKQYKPVRRFPASEFDLSFVAGARVYSSTVEGALRTAASEKVESVAFLREYVLGDGSRSLTYRTVVAAQDRTLTSEEINAERERMIAAGRSAGFELRG